MWREALNLWQTVRDPEYAHLLLESLPLFGIAAGLVFLCGSLLFRENKSRLLALLLVCVSSGSVWPYVELREKAQARVIAMHDPSFAPLIREQTSRRKDTAWAFYAMSVISGLALLFGLAGKGRGLLILTIVAATAAFWLSLWLHKKEAEIYHRNILKHAR
ncbi:MAG: hypothetical protein K1X78_26015 [Verrucomicrobiaceae bacterium]|nr:hypothetical protein [Verrucomicrobiaceae bacterium]